MLSHDDKHCHLLETTNQSKKDRKETLKPSYSESRTSNSNAYRQSNEKSLVREDGATRKRSYERISSDNNTTDWRNRPINRSPENYQSRARYPNSHNSQADIENKYKAREERSHSTYRDQGGVPKADIVGENWRWREKQDHSAKPDHTDSGISKARRPPLERDLTASVPLPLPPLPSLQTTEEIMAELREVTVQYTSCPDPTESAARKKRVIQGEAKELMKNTAQRIMEATTAQHTAIQQLHADHLDTREQSPTHNTPPRETIIIPTSQAKRRGRPPLNKKQTGNTVITQKGSSSKRRIVQKIPRSPRRSAANSKVKTKASSSRPSTSAPIGENNSQSNQGPIINLFPPRVKKTADFPNPQKLLP